MKRKPALFPDEQKERRRAGMRAALLCALLLAAGALVWRQSARPAPPIPAPAPTVTAAPAPATGRSAREIAYDKDVAALRALLAKADDSVREQAQRQLAQMIANHQTELGVEEALTRAGFAPCFALMQNNALTVAVGAKELTAAQSASILAICTAHSDVAVENIRIMTGEEA